MSVEAFMSAAREAPSQSGSDAEAIRLAAELREMAVRAAARAPRTVQTDLGPSELGTACDRQVVHKMAGLPATNHVSDPWPSIVGTSVHAWLADALDADDSQRWRTERRVWPTPDIYGTADLYDARHAMVIDHKCQGRSTQDKLRKSGPSRTYYVQLLLYALGYLQAGYPVQAIAIASWPRTGSSLAGLYVWHHVLDDTDWQLLGEVLDTTAVRRDYAELVRAGLLDIAQVPRTPSSDDCFFCPAYRPQSGDDGGPGCPGTTA